MQMVRLFSKKVKDDYNIKMMFLRVLIRDTSSFLSQRSRRNENKGFIDEEEAILYVHFLDRKKRITFGGVARFCTVA